MAHSTRMGGYYMPPDKKQEEGPVSKLNRDSTKIAIEQVQGLMTQIAKDALFNLPLNKSNASSSMQME